MTPAADTTPCIVGPSAPTGPSSAGAPAFVARRTFRRLTWEILSNDPLAPPYQWFVASSYQVMTSCLVVAMFGLYGVSQAALRTVVYCSAAAFSLEYVLRVWSCLDAPPDHGFAGQGGPCRARVRFALSWPMLLDLLSLVSFLQDLLPGMPWLRGLVALRSLRLLNILRMERSFQVFRPLGIVICQQRRELAATLCIALMVLLLSSVMMYFIESPTNSQFSNVVESAWWATAALTTVGYGDIAPSTPWGRLLGGVVAFFGVGLFALPAGIITSGFMEHMQEKGRQQQLRRRQLHRQRWSAEADRREGHIDPAARTPGQPLLSPQGAEDDVPPQSPEGQSPSQEYGDSERLSQMQEELRRLQELVQAALPQPSQFLSSAATFPDSERHVFDERLSRIDAAIGLLHEELEDLRGGQERILAAVAAMRVDLCANRT